MVYQGFSLFSRSHPQGDRSAQAANALRRVGLLTLCLVGQFGPLSGLILHSAIGASAAEPTSQAQAPRAATVLYVNPAGGQDAVGAGLSTATPLRSITYAMLQAEAGTTIQLAPGSYSAETGETFPIVVRPGVILRGNEADKGQTVAIVGGGNFISKTYARQTATLLTSAGSEIRGVTVTNPQVRGTGVWVESVNPVIQNSTFANNNREGIFITGTGNPKVLQNVFFKNGGNGISTANNARGEIQENLFQETGFGLAASENAAPVLVSNRFVGNTDGLYLNDTAKPILRSNIIENSQRDGIVITGAAQPDLGSQTSAGNNIIRNNRQYDLNNSTSLTIYSIGNTLDSKKIIGRVEFSGDPIASGDGNQPPAGQVSFPDVRGHWAQTYIEALASRNIITGFPGGAFRPDDVVTRAQYAAIISKAFNPPAKQAGMQFQDINSSFWGYQPIQSVVRGGFMKGYPEGDFKPNQEIPRVQALVALVTGLGFPAAPNAGTMLAQFNDGTQIPNWAQPAIATATQRKLVVNYPALKQFNPNRNATRAEIAAVVYQAMVAAGQAPALPSPYIVTP